MKNETEHEEAWAALISLFFLDGGSISEAEWKMTLKECLRSCKYSRMRSWEIALGEICQNWKQGFRGCEGKSGKSTVGARDKTWFEVDDWWNELQVKRFVKHDNILMKGRSSRIHIDLFLPKIWMKVNLNPSKCSFSDQSGNMRRKPEAQSSHKSSRAFYSETSQMTHQQFISRRSFEIQSRWGWSSWKSSNIFEVLSSPPRLPLCSLILTMMLTSSDDCGCVRW